MPVGSKPVRLRWPQAEPDDTYERLLGSLVGEARRIAGNVAKLPELVKGFQP